MCYYVLIFKSLAKINVKLQAFYGFSCGGFGHGSEETLEVEVNEIEVEALQKLGTEEISCEAVVEAIENGETELQSLHERLEEEFYYMVEEYWLFEADNECINESLEESLEKDLSEGIYTHPVSFDEFVEQLKTGEIELENKDLDYLKEFALEDEYDFEDEEDLQYKYRSYLWDKYYDWICEHDHEFIAERVGLDIDACRDDEIDYTIHL